MIQHSGASNLADMLAQLAPTLDPAGYHFCSVDLETAARLLAEQGCFAAVNEASAWTVVIDEHVAHAQQLIPDDAPHFCRIVLGVQSDLMAVGLTAVVAGELAEQEIPCNVIAGLQHDHLFVPKVHAEHALAVLQGLAG